MPEGIAARTLLLPLAAMQFTSQVVWDAADFAAFGAMLLGACGVYELAARMTGNAAYRAAVGVAVVAAVILIWMNLAIGIIGSENSPANVMYGGVLAVRMLAALTVRFRPCGMARVGRDCACSGYSQRGRWIGLHWGELASDHRVPDRMLRRPMAPIGLAVSESGAGANLRGRSAVGSACNVCFPPGVYLLRGEGGCSHST